MVMALKLVRHQTSQTLLLLAGYEGGVTAAFMLPGNCTGFAVEAAQLIYLSQPHSQPVLSLDVLPEGDFYFTSSADAIIAMHQIPNLSAKQRKNDLSKAQQHEDDDTPLNSKQQAHQGEEEAVEEPLSVLSVIQDEEMLDRPPDTQQIPRSGSLAASSSLSFAKRPVWKTRSRPSELSRLSSILFSSKPLPSDQPAPSIPSVDTPQPPYKIKNTGHAGQQSLHVRSDGRLLITGGWDTRTRIYSSRTLKEVAMLKWHKKGVYAVAFNDILTEGELGSLENEKARLRRALLKIEQQLATKSEGPIPSSEVQQWFNVLSTAMDEDYLMFNMILGTAERERWAAEIFSDVIETYKVDDSNRDREFKTKLSHYVAAGDKDGKVSLWEMF
jgi:WD40 repeat protein